MAENVNVWVAGAFGSFLGGMIVSYYLGDKKVKEKILIVLPWLLIGALITTNYLETFQLKAQTQNHLVGV